MRKKLPFLAGMLLLALAVLGLIAMGRLNAKRGASFEGARFVLSDGAEENAPAVRFMTGESFI